MILTDEPTSPLKARQAALDRDVEQEGDTSSAPPPSPPPYAPPYGDSPYLLASRPQRGQSAARRFFEAFCLAILIWALAGMLISSVFGRSSENHRGRKTDPDSGFPTIPSPPADPSIPTAPGTPNTPGAPSTPETPPEGHTSRCIGGQDWSPSRSRSSKFPYSAQTQFKYPVSTEVLYLLAQGELAYGSVKVMDWDDEGDDVVIDVTAGYYSQEALDRAKVCAVSRKDGENGIGIFTPTPQDSDPNYSRIKFEVIVQIPVRHASHHIFNAFETIMPQFSHEFYFSRPVSFHSMSVRGSNMPIYAVNLNVEYALLITSNSGISGSFNASTSLELRTSNAPIKATIGLVNEPDTSSTDLIMKTSNGPIEAIISLISTTDTKGSFNVNTTTNNNPIKIDYRTSPINSTLIHNSRTSNSPATVFLHSAYEGSFSAESSTIKPTIEHDSHARDPSGRQRTRWIELFSDKKRATGGIYWGQKKPEVNSSVTVSTSNAPATLLFL